MDKLKMDKIDVTWFVAKSFGFYWREKKRETCHKIAYCTCTTSLLRKTDMKADEIGWWLKSDRRHKNVDTSRDSCELKTLALLFLHTEELRRGHDACVWSDVCNRLQLFNGRCFVVWTRARTNTIQNFSTRHENKEIWAERRIVVEDSDENKPILRLN